MLLRVLIIWNWTRVTLALWNASQWKPTFQVKYGGWVTCVLKQHESSSLTDARNKWDSHLAVDGISNPDFLRGSCSHTLSDKPAWWMVDLQGLYSVKQVVITNRKSYSRDRLKKFRIEFFTTDPRLDANYLNITGQVCARQDKALLSGDNVLTCGQGIVGRFARLIWQPGYKEFLTICEFEVLVDEVHSRSIRYDKFIGQRATNKAFLTLTTDALWKCGWECSHRRDKQLCTAFNWAPERRECHLLSVDPRSNVTKITDNDWLFFSNL